MGTSGTTGVRISNCWARSLSEVCSGYERVLILVSTGGRERGTLEIASRALVDMETTVLPPAPANPSVEKLVHLYGDMNLRDFTAVVAIGGGSVIDTAKTMALARSCASAADFEERLKNESLPSDVCDFDVVAVPTTAGTGSEVTPFATVWDTNDKRKLSISGDFLRPKFAVLDPSLLVSLKGDALLFPALDAVSHAIESLWSKNATYQSRLHAATALGLLSQSIGTCVTRSPDFRRLSLGSLYAGLAIALSRTAIAHSISYPLTLRYGVPHGLACSFTLSAIHDHISGHMGPYCEESDLIERTLEQVRLLNLGQRISTYLSLSEAQNYVHEMVTPGRGDNCVLPFESDEILKILASGYS